MFVSNCQAQSEPKNGEKRMLFPSSSSLLYLSGSARTNCIIRLYRLQLSKIDSLFAIIVSIVSNIVNKVP